MHLQRKLESNSACPGKDSEDTWEGLKFIPQAYSWHRDSPKESEKQHRQENLEKGRIQISKITTIPNLMKNMNINI